MVGCFPQKIRIAAAIGLARISVPFFFHFRGGHYRRSLLAVSMKLVEKKRSEIRNVMRDKLSDLKSNTVC